MEAYIEKPFRVADVVAAVENALQARSIRGDQTDLGGGGAPPRRGDRGVSRGRFRRRPCGTCARRTAIDPLRRTGCTSTSACSTASRGSSTTPSRELETALHINGKHFPALKNLAVLYQKAGFRNKAIETWERALGVAPDDPTRQSIKEHLLRAALTAYPMSPGAKLS